MGGESPPTSAESHALVSTRTLKEQEKLDDVAMEHFLPEISAVVTWNNKTGIEK